MLLLTGTSHGASRLEHRAGLDFVVARSCDPVFTLNCDKVFEGHNHGCGPPGLILLFACFLAGSLTGQRFLHPFLLARFQVKGVTFYFLNNVLRLHFPLEAAQGVFE